MKRSIYLLAMLGLLVAISLSQIGCSGYNGVAVAGPAYGGVAYGALFATSEIALERPNKLRAVSNSTSTYENNLRPPTHCHPPRHHDSEDGGCFHRWMW